jgi:hypothetical protein
MTRKSPVHWGSHIINKLYLLGAALAAVSAAPSVAATQVYFSTVQNLAGNQAYTGTLGLNFDVNSPISISALGVFDDSSNGLQSSLAVTIYDRTTGLALFTPVVFAAGTANTGDEYIFQNIAPLLLGAGSYQLAAWNYGASEMNYNNSGPGGPISFNNLNGAITAVGTSYSGTRGVFATIPDVGLTRYGAGSFKATAVPEPATWAMFLIGFGAVGYSMRSRKVGYKAVQAV